MNKHDQASVSSSSCSSSSGLTKHPVCGNPDCMVCAPEPHGPFVGHGIYGSLEDFRLKRGVYAPGFAQLPKSAK